MWASQCILEGIIRCLASYLSSVVGELPTERALSSWLKSPLLKPVHPAPASSLKRTHTSIASSASHIYWSLSVTQKCGGWKLALWWVMTIRQQPVPRHLSSLPCRDSWPVSVWIPWGASLLVGTPLGRVTSYVTVFTDTSVLSCWGTCLGRAVEGTWP